MVPAIRILLLEDNPDEVDQIAQLLRDDGLEFDLAVAKTAEQCRTAFRQGDSNLILARPSSGCQNGVSAIEAAAELCPGVPVVCVCSESDESECVRLWRVGLSACARRDRPGHIAAAVLSALRECDERARRERAEKAVRDSERQHRMTLDAMGDAIHVVDRDLRIVLINTELRRWETQLGLGAAIAGKRLQEAFPFLSETVFQEYEQVFETGTILLTEEVNTVRGEKVWTETRKIPVVENGNVTRVVTVIRDTTRAKLAEEERRRLEARMLAMQKYESLATLASGVAHDFNNVLQAILGAAEYLQERLSAETDVQRDIQLVRSSAQRASQLTRQMLDFAGCAVVQPVRLNVASLVRGMGSLLEATVSKGIRLCYGLSEEEGCSVWGDPGQLEQVVVNLVLNAEEATEGPGGEITVRTGVMMADEDCVTHAVGSVLTPGECAFVEVSDCGCGIDEDTKGKMFDPFFSTKFIGRGLGLAAVLGIVRGHGGAILVDSESGMGTTVRVLLPCAPDFEHGDDTDLKVGAVTDAWCAEGTVLLVDDEPGVRYVTRRALEAGGLEVLLAQDGREAVEVFRERGTDIDLVVLDVSMPEMDGIRALEQIRQLRPGTAILVSSGYDEKDVRSRVAGAAEFLYLHKPYTKEELLAEVHSILGAKGNGSFGR